jgi:hypothetical protein
VLGTLLAFTSSSQGDPPAVGEIVGSAEWTRAI